ncbi:phage terminase small subunit P27 family [Methylobacterium ajmalii]|uniref:Phage terminase small subunit P27 family n=1 Tax=Methylobacterium ajmalii TaxID=2738439 RepID=A0ABV0A827_9HYPH
MKGRKPASLVTAAAPAAMPRPPAWFGKEAKAEWRRVAPILMNERRTLDLADLAAFTSYCLAVEQVAVASRALGTDYTYASASGLMKANPLVGIRDKAMAQVLRHAAELGMTSVSRSRATMRDDDADDSLVDF